MAALMPGSDGRGGESSMVYFCLGRTQTFSCEVPKQGSLPRLEWRIDFEHSSRPSEASVTRQFISSDPEGYILRESRPGVSFVFNLTANINGSSKLVSVMSITVDDNNATALVNNATVNCGDEANQKILHVIEGNIKSNWHYCAFYMIANSQ
ncbi:MAG: hypothetical protein MJE68_31765 [Proteobacteria bacterium]|nr:hypothetical protein [Pseudomonadota bacterium]